MTAKPRTETKNLMRTTLVATLTLVPERFYRSKLIGIEAERAVTLDFDEILIQFCGSESREFLAAERPYLG